MKKILVGILGMLMLVGGLNIGDGRAQTPPSYTVEGYVRTPGGTAINGVTMTGLPENPSTNTDGYYSVTVPSGWSGTVKPNKIGYAIHPFLKEYTDVTSNLVQEDHTGTLLPKVALALVLQKTSYGPGEPITIVMTLENQGNAIVTSQGFMKKGFHLNLCFTDPDGKLITSNSPIGRTPAPPPMVPVIIEEKVQLLSVEYVESIPGNWVWPMTFNALDYYSLTKGGQYSVIAKFSMRDYLEMHETDPGSGVFYAPMESGSSGEVESNIVNFTLIPPPAFVEYVSPDTSSLAPGSTRTLTARIRDQAGNTVTNNSESMTFAVQAGPGTVSGLPPLVAIVNGQATTSAISAGLVGNVTIRASSGNFGPADVSFNVIPGASTKLVFSGQRSNAAAGASIMPAVTVQIQDTNGNVLTSSNASVNLAIGTNPAGGTLRGTTTKNAISGVATFDDLWIDKVGASYTLKASSDGLTGATSNAFKITPGPLNQLVISPASATINPGGSQTYTATGYDQYNNGLGNVTAATTFSISPDGSCTGNTCTAMVGGLRTVTGKNGGKTATASLQVSNYNFAGFLSPVGNPPAVNSANAGQTIPVKWRITDAKGVGVSDPKSFDKLTSNNANCNTWTAIGNPTVEAASGASGLQYLGSGNWQYNWKTPKNYAGTCRIITIKLKDGTEHKARFKFTK